MTTNNANSRSGYAAEIMPDILTADESKGKALPIGTLKGDQHGRPRVDPVTLGQAAYKVVSTQEAQSNMQARLNGALPPIKGGIDDVASHAEVAKGLRMKKNTKKAETVAEEQTIRKSAAINDTDNYDPLGGEYEPGDAALQAEERALAEPSEQRSSRLAQIDDAERQAPAALRAVIREKRPDIHDMWLAQRSRVTLELPDSTVTMPCIDVKECKVGITLLLPINQDGGMMIPKPGVEVTVSHKDRTWKCYFPGVYAEIVELNMASLTFIKAD